MDAEAVSQMVEQCSAMMASMQQMMDGVGDMGGTTGAIGQTSDMMAMAGVSTAPPWLLIAAIGFAVVLVGAVAAIAVGRARFRASKPAATAIGPEGELERLYAAGHMNRKQFLRVRDDLRGAQT